MNLGDITVSKTPKGYEVARNGLDRNGSGSSWHLIAAFVNFEDAAYFTKVLAGRDGVQAWFCSAAGSYEPLENHELMPPLF